MIKNIAVTLASASKSQAFQKIGKASGKVSCAGDYFLSNCSKRRFATNSWFYKSFSSSMNEETTIKNSKLAFKNETTSFLPYFMHPSVAPTDNPSIHQIRASNILLLSYVLQAEPEFAAQAWENRKSIGLNFRQTLKILSIKPGEKKHEIITKLFEKQDFVQKKVLQIEDLPEKKQVQIRLKCFDPSNKAQQQMSKWQISINLDYADYLTLHENIKSNILYISGCSFQIQYSKSRNMALAQEKSQRYFESLNKNSKAVNKEFKYLTKEKKK